MPDEIINPDQLVFTRINGIRATSVYGKNFIEINHQSTKHHTLFEDVYEANYSLHKDKFSLLSLIGEDFINSDTNAYEYLLVYIEPNVLIHWQQTKSIHSHENNVEPEILHADASLKSFNGLACSSVNNSFLGN